MKRKYYARPNTQFTDEDAAIIGAYLDEMFPEHNYTPKEIVDLAEDPESPIHEYFEWDNTRAAALYRLQQARKLIGCVVEIVGSTNIPKAVSVVVRTEGGEKKRTYMDTKKAMETPSAWQQVLQEALRQIKAWRERYARFKELEGIFNEVDKTIEEIERCRKQKQKQSQRKKK